MTTAPRLDLDEYWRVARSSDWSAELKGPGVFAAFGVPDPIAPEAATRIIDCVSRYIGVPTIPLIA